MVIEKIPPAIVVHAGSRDNYQVAAALQENGCLKSLVTNVYWEKVAREKYNVSFSNSKRHVDIPSLIGFAFTKVFPKINCDKFTEYRLGMTARALSIKEAVPIFSCSYTAYEAFKNSPNQPRFRFLFQIHPHPISVRRFLLEEIERCPEWKPSLLCEAELSNDEKRFQNLAQEPELANGWVTASSFTAKTLAENGVDLQKIHVVPYGLDTSFYSERGNYPPDDGFFRIIFLGSLIQRKGISDLLESIKMVKSKKIKVLLRGRFSPNTEYILNKYKDLSLDIQLNLPNRDVIRDLQSSHLFILPSIVEGFGHSILQAMGCGTPVITTPNTCAPDIIDSGKHGFIVPIREPRIIAERIDWCLSHRSELNDMGKEAALKAREYTWANFRRKIWESYISMYTNIERINSL